MLSTIFKQITLNLSNKINIGLSKGRQYREIPISEQFMTAYKLRKEANESDKYIFSKTNGEKLNENYLLKRLKPMLYDPSVLMETSTNSGIPMLLK